MSIGINSIDYQFGFTAGYAQAKAEVKHGHWIKDEHDFLVCSECGNIAEYLPILGQIETPYCSECGARMDEVEE